MREELRRWRDWRRARPAPLRLLVLSVADRCDQRCLHCQIWQGGSASGQGLSLDERLRVADEALAAGARQALLTGGEPLLSADLWPVAARLRAGGARLMLATNGMLLERWAGPVAELFAEVYLSLDGAAATHDAARGVPAFARVQAGVRALRAAGAAVRVTTRTTLHALNLGEVEAIVEAARALGAHHASFLALDASSAAFGGDLGARRALVPTAGQIAAFEAAVDRLAARGALGDGFVLESPERLRALAAHLRASAGQARFERPRCDAPWWSVVVEADGALRPCFFHAAAGDARGGLENARRSGAFRAALRSIRGANPTCDRCVCPKWAGAARA
jgi:MoaA/NifB/PqqE/SkfB family radical SAM enzyme